LTLKSLSTRINNFPGAVVLIPNPFSCAFPVLRDGVADKLDIIVVGTFSRPFEDEVLPTNIAAGARHRNNRGVRSSGRRIVLESLTFLAGS